MGLVDFALRRPITVMVLVLALVLGAAFAAVRVPVDVFPNLNLPVIYVAQTYGGMDPAQMEGFLVSYYEYHFLYIAGIEHVESRSIQNVALIKLYFHPGTDMSQALAQTIAYVERSRAFMPPGTVAPFVMRFDAGSVPVGQLVFSSATRPVSEVQDLALFRVRPMFATLPGVSAPPPFGGNQRTVVIRADPDRLRAYGMSADDLVAAVASGNTIVPAGNVRIGNLNRLTPTNGVVGGIKELLDLPLRKGWGANAYLRDVASVDNAADILSGYALVNGRRTVYIPVTKRAEASTLDVVGRVRAALPAMQALLPDDIRVSFEFDQSVYVRNAVHGLGLEGAIGALLTGLMVLLFLRDARSAFIVVTTIPLAVLAALLALMLAGQTLNIMTLGGLALAVGILVDEAAVAIENIHAHLAAGVERRRAIYEAVRETMTPRLLAMLAILAVFAPALFMVGIPRSLFVPLALAVGFAMIASYVLSSTYVPVLAAWILSSNDHGGDGMLIGFMRRVYGALLRPVIFLRWLIVPAYAVAVAAALIALVRPLGTDIFPAVDTGQFQIRMRAPTGTRVERTEEMALRLLDVIRREVEPGQVALSLGFVGTQPPSYPINSIYLWTSGPHEAVFLFALGPDRRPRMADLTERLRKRIAAEMPDVSVSFEPGDVISQVMNFGAAAPVEVAVAGPNMHANRTLARQIKDRLAGVPGLRDLQYGQPLDYPTLDVEIDRVRAGQLGTSVQEIGRSLLAGTSSSRFVQPNYWRDPASGVAYQVQVEVPQNRVASIEDVENLPVSGAGGSVRVGDVARLRTGTMIGEVDRYNMQRMVTLVANVSGRDLGSVARDVHAAVAAAGTPPKGVTVSVRGQIKVMEQTLAGLQTGLGVSLLTIFLLLAAYFESIGLALVVMSSAPAVLVGVAAALVLTGTTINVQSCMGMIMAVGVSAANAILLVTFAEVARAKGLTARDAAVAGATGRLRAILMTSIAMIAGMVPMALGLGEGGEQTAPLGRAVIGGLSASTLAVLAIVPAVYALLQGRAGPRRSLHPDDELSTGQGERG